MKSTFLATTALVLFACATTARAQGSSLVADFNGDGIDDLAVGAPTSHGLRGSVSIIFGVAGGFSATTFTTPNVTRVGLTVGERYGEALAAADFDGDGRSELAVGAPFWSGGRGRIDILRVLPSAGPLLLVVGKFYSQDTSGIAGRAQPDDWFGRALATGDFDGNGYPDLAVGVPGETIDGVSHAGAVQVLYARSTGITVERNQFWSQLGSVILDEPEADDQFGSALAAGDFNGDGIDDLAVGVPLEDFSLLGQRFIDQGAVNVVFGTPTGLSSKSDQFLAISNGGQFRKARLGYALAAVDINGDGFADLAIGGPNGLDAVGFVAVSYGSAGGLGAPFACRLEAWGVGVEDSVYRSARRRSIALSARQGRASSTRLKGVSVARRNLVNPPLITTSRKRASPACAPNASPTSWLFDAGVQIIVEAE
jgi:hypothetical protein